MQMHRRLFLFFASLVYLAVLLSTGPQNWIGEAIGAPVSDIRATKHNFSSAAAGSTISGGQSGFTVPSRTIYSSTESQVCVFCHTPHGANISTTTPGIDLIKAPLWNRSLSGATYTLYSSTSLDAVLNSPGGSSKLCLSCHDGSLAPANVNNAPGSGGIGGTINAGTGMLTKFDTSLTSMATTGFTRHIGGTAAEKDLSNDHPISVTYSSTLRNNDGELRAPADYTGVTSPGLRSPGKKPFAPLESTNSSGADGQVQCASCHDPHVVEQDRANFGTANKFMRLNRFQSTSNPSSTDGAFSPDNDISCLACHQKKGWGYSAHANSTVANEVYDASGKATIVKTYRQFAIGAADASGIPVWRAACLNCHDTHTVPGATRLLREGVTSIDSSGARTGSARRLENTCFQCHSSNSNNYNVLPSGTSSSTTLRLPGGTTGATVPDVETDFLTGTNKRMPLVQTTETHDIINADFQECRKYLGSSNVAETDSAITTKCSSMPLTASNTNRHVECTDCHNPHRVRRGALFTDIPNDTSGSSGRYRTHIPANSSGTFTSGAAGNIISGALRGSWGVQPSYGTGAMTTWPQLPSGFEVKKGDPGSSTSLARSETFLTREHQLCFKCHSNYAYNDNNEYGTADKASNTTTNTREQASGRPVLGSPGTTSGTNNVKYYTNQAAEWAVYADDTVASGKDQGEGISSANNGGTYASQVNHRSWHPVTYPTGRGLTQRAISGTTPWRAPFAGKIGTLTMHCSDCHGNAGTWTVDSGPDNTKTQGPHGSSNNFLLRGAWSTATSSTSTGDLCFNCHITAVYASGSDESSDRTGFCCDEKTNMHIYHLNSKARNGNNRCTICHVAIPHGWRNKAFLVNLNAVGPEGGFASDTSVNTQAEGINNGYDNPPYYLKAKLRVTNWKKSNSWLKGDCFGGEGGMQAQCVSS